MDPPHKFSNGSLDWSLDEYNKTSDIKRTLVGNKIADNSDVVGA